MTKQKEDESDVDKKISESEIDERKKLVNESKELVDELMIEFLRKEKRFETLKIALIGALLLMLLFLPFFLVGSSQNKIVMFNVKDTTNSFLNQVAKLDIDENQQKALVARYQQNLTDIMKEYHEKGIVVLSMSAVLTPVEDKTAEIKSEISKRMKNKGE